MEGWLSIEEHHVAIGQVTLHEVTHLELICCTPPITEAERPLERFGARITVDLNVIRSRPNVRPVDNKLPAKRAEGGQHTIRATSLQNRESKMRPYDISSKLVCSASFVDLTSMRGSSRCSTSTPRGCERRLAGET